MKRCPNCNQIFDNGYDFCLNDGTLLVSEVGSRGFGGFESSGEMPTQVIPRAQNTEYPPLVATSYFSSWVFPVVGILCGLVVVLGFFAFFRETSSDKAVVSQQYTEPREANKNTESRPTREVEPTPVPPPSMPPPPLSLPQRPPPPPPPPPSVNQLAYPLVTVNSPRDGYLALKSEPCIAPCGTTLRNIPHGTRLSLGTCKNNLEVADRRRGRWCYTTYGGYTGWVFDAFVTR